jgi:cysteine desulfurase family protein (TIGR01976 family)
MASPSEISPALRSHRADFPSLKRTHLGYPLAFLDGPAGTQVPMKVIDAVTRYYGNSNANTHGQFVTAVETDQLLQNTRDLMAAFLGADGGETISFGANMTTLNFSLSRAIARSLRPGDEILITQLDHEANRGPWLTLKEHGIVVQEIRMAADASLDYDDFRLKINEQTRLVAMGWASNAFGTVNDIAFAREATQKVGAWLLVDAVHYAPHFPIDVRTMGMDFLLCSAYKFYGPHVGILYTCPGLLDKLQTDRLRTQDPNAPFRIETGTLNHAAIAGVRAAVEYLASLGSGSDFRSKIVSAIERLADYEHALASTLYDGLCTIDGVKIHGQTFVSRWRAPTIAMTLEGTRPGEICRWLAQKGICCWDGHFYAIRPMEVLGLLEQGGVTRVGISLYNIEEEISRLLNEVSVMAKGR